ncbi:MAG TPA: CRISPR-associated protein Cas4 [Aquabacterium sp.]|nr:CRISPR-associated protein Cas4 [Aquabacterium sp.]
MADAPMPPPADDEALPLSALQHWAYCPRQCALIHLDQAFDDNLHTLRGNAVHAQVDQVGVGTAKGVRISRALPLWHDALGLIGKADVVEFGPGGQPYPVEYKVGNRHKAAAIAACDDLQLAAQAICLEAMTDLTVPEGAIFYAASKRRRVVPITSALRRQVVDTATDVRRMLQRQALPAPLAGADAQQRCKGCSLRERCMPQAADPSALRVAAMRLFDPDA